MTTKEKLLRALIDLRVPDIHRDGSTWMLVPSQVDAICSIVENLYAEGMKAAEGMEKALEHYAEHEGGGICWCEGCDRHDVANEALTEWKRVRE